MKADCSSPPASSCLSSLNVEESWLPMVERAALIAVTAATAPLTPEASSTALLIADRFSSASSASWSSDSFACSPASVSGVAEAPHVVDEVARRALDVVDGAPQGVLAQVPALERVGRRRDRVLPGRDRRTDVVGPGGRRVFVFAAAAAGQKGGQQRDDDPSEPAVHRVTTPNSPLSVSLPSFRYAARALALIASYSACVIAPLSSRPLAFSISPAAPPEPAVVRT